MKINNLFAQQALKRAEVIQQLISVPTEVLEILPAVIASVERINLNPLEVMQKMIEKADRAEPVKEMKWNPHQATISNTEPK